MVDKDTRSNGRTWMDFNLGPKTPKLTMHPRQELKAMVPQKVGNTVSCQCFDARIGQKDLQRGTRCWVIFFYNIDGFTPPSHTVLLLFK